MSISSEITRIQGAVGDAYAAVTAKGGTATTSKVADLATAISTIPAGGSEKSADYGVLFYNKFIGIDCTIWIDESVFRYTDGGVAYSNFVKNTILAAHSGTGTIAVTSQSYMADHIVFGAMWDDGVELQWEKESYELNLERVDWDADMEIQMQIEKRYSGVPTHKNLATEQEFNLLCNFNSSSVITIDGEEITGSKIIGFNFGSLMPNTIGNNFLAGAGGLCFVRGNIGSNVTSIGSNFLRGCSNLTTFSSMVLRQVTSIGENFMKDCSRYTGVCYLFCPASAFGNNPPFLTSYNNKPSYEYGVELCAGSPTVDDILSAFPGSSTAPYYKTRKASY